jgi:hypothetical protein
MRLLFIPMAVAWLTGCATISPAECAKAYDVGFRDAIYGLQKQDGIWVPLCEKQSAQLDLAEYGRGWQEGKYERDRRTVHGGVD